MLELTYVVLYNPPEGYLFPTLFLIIAHDFCSFYLTMLKGLRLEISWEREGKPPSPQPHICLPLFLLLDLLVNLFPHPHNCLPRFLHLMVSLINHFSLSYPLLLSVLSVFDHVTTRRSFVVDANSSTELT